MTGIRYSFEFSGDRLFQCSDSDVLSHIVVGICVERYGECKYSVNPYSLLYFSLADRKKIKKNCLPPWTLNEKRAKRGV